MYIYLKISSRFTRNLLFFSCFVYQFRFFLGHFNRYRLVVKVASFQYLSTNLTLDKSLYQCEISGAECDYTDFYSFEARAGYRHALINCYVVNGGRNSSGHLSEIKSTRTTELFAGFLMRFILPKYHFLFYYISDAYVKPTKSEINAYLNRLLLCLYHS